MLKRERLHKIVEMVNTQGIITVNEIINKLNVSDMTIRRDLDELDKIPGVGEATANKILSYREENGDFKNIEEIKNVNGIGEKKFENMKDIICVK